MIQSDTFLKSDDRSLSESIAVLIASTKRKKRKLSLPEVAEHLNRAINAYGSIAALADDIDLSTQMLKQFLCIDKLSDEIKKLFKTRTIDSVDIACHLSFFPKEEQIAVAKHIADGHLNSKDVRAVKDLKKINQNLKITNAIKSILETKNRKEYIILLDDDRIEDKSQLEIVIQQIAGKDNIISIGTEKDIFKIVINEVGRKNLLKISGKEHITMKKLITMIANGNYRYGK